MLAHLGHICRIGEVLGVSRLVFGSPRSRDRGALADEEVLGMAVAFFRRLGDIAAGYSMQVCLEPNPPCYGANFMTCSEETAAVVMAVSHPAIRMQLDTGAIAINGEDPEEIVREYAHLIGHVHASEPNLVVLGDAHADHAAVAASLRAYLPDQIVSIEMLASKGEASITAIERAVGVAIAHYGADYGRERYSPKRSP
jgi:sugar phosphate isomerase/epimerase